MNKILYVFLLLSQYALAEVPKERSCSNQELTNIASNLLVFHTELELKANLAESGDREKAIYREKYLKADEKIDSEVAQFSVPFLNEYKSKSEGNISRLSEQVISRDPEKVAKAAKDLAAAVSKEMWVLDTILKGFSNPNGEMANLSEAHKLGLLYGIKNVRKRLLTHFSKIIKNAASNILETCFGFSFQSNINWDGKNQKQGVFYQCSEASIDYTSKLPPKEKVDQNCYYDINCNKHESELGDITFLKDMIYRVSCVKTHSGCPKAQQCAQADKVESVHDLETPGKEGAK
jgi:hypothetical protein